MNSLDVVVVPDFQGEKSRIFEARTLLFLASWLEYGGKARDFPLHLACIGEPPDSVRRLAQVCDARISVHKPVTDQLPRFANKLRGFEVEAQTESLLLVDLDVLVLGDFSSLANYKDCISAAPENVARVLEDYWQRIYAGLNVALPLERIPTVRWELGMSRNRIPFSNGEDSAMLPYFNSGIIIAPWSCDLRQKWQENIISIAALFDNERNEQKRGWKAVCACDQAGFAVAIEQLKQEGVSFRRLPHDCHSNTNHLYRRTVSLEQTKLFHALRMFRNPAHFVDEMKTDLKFFHHQYRKLLIKGDWARDRTQPKIVTMRNCLWPALKDNRRFYKRLKYLNEKYVEKYR